jgi:hypothetical protein
MYSRTIDENGRTTSRCLYCFMTVGSEAESAVELGLTEERHLCPERALAELLACEQGGLRPLYAQVK